MILTVNFVRIYISMPVRVVLDCLFSRMFATCIVLYNMLGLYLWFALILMCARSRLDLLVCIVFHLLALE
ncbi:hypothetical protein L1987_52726 [Smallanthus sonchifolius]|uniref:Uncharacterized protein n=1 Tax=Smallanthus sonchifolius TaxID=185202 RepID=A0ACB9EUA3_9ASTR|nr:hypothetical protein L1987_52726 [Smallanthus sonchifolius]